MGNVIAKAKISIVLPVYNAQDYIERCLGSIRKQTFESYEVIIVDDGSTDNSGEICRAYMAKDSRFRYIQKENSGVAAARNLGLKNVDAQYVVFVDADDYLHESYLYEMINGMKKDLCNLAICNYYYDYGHKLKKSKTIIKKSDIDVKDYYKEIIKDPLHFYFGVLWNKIFNMEVIIDKHLVFDETLEIMEDWDFVLKYLPYTQKVALISKELYYYNQDNPNSITKKLDDVEKSYKTRINAYENLVDVGNKLGIYKKFENSVNSYILHYLVNQHFNTLLLKKNKVMYTAHRNIKKRDIISRIISEMDKKFFYTMGARLYLRYGIKYLRTAIRRSIRK